MALPAAGLYRTTQAHPAQPEAIPAGALVYVGKNDTGAFVVRPHMNENNRWFWRDPTVPLTDEFWSATLKALPTEGFYTLPETLTFESGGRWVENAIVQLGYDQSGSGIIFVAERREAVEGNALHFSDRGHRVDDDLLYRLRWAPILPVPDAPGAVRH